MRIVERVAADQTLWHPKTLRGLRALGEVRPRFVNPIVVLVSRGKHAMSYASEASEWRGLAYWICTFSNSQWKVKDELGIGGWQAGRISETML